MNQLLGVLAHITEAHPGEAGNSLAQTIFHVPTWQGLITSAGLLAILYLLLKSAGVRFAYRLFAVLAGLIVLGVLSLPHNATVTAVLLSAGFVSTFVLAFSLVAKK